MASLIPQQLSLKYQNQFLAHFANPINELIYDNYHTPHRIFTKELFMTIADSQTMLAYETSPQLYRETLESNAYLFQWQGLTTQMPLMILTNTKEIFKRRKRLQRRLNKGSNTISNQSSSLYSSPSSIIYESSVQILDISPSDITFMNMDSSFPQIYSHSIANIYSWPSNIQQSATLNNKQAFQYEHFLIRKIVQSELKHLTIEFSSKTTKVIEHNDQSQQSKDIEAYQQRPSNYSIESVVKAQLRRYNVGQLEMSSINTQSNVSTKKKIREKAQQLLMNIGNKIINR